MYLMPRCVIYDIRAFFCFISPIMDCHKVNSDNIKGADATTTDIKQTEIFRFDT